MLERIGGLGDGLATTPYTADLVHALRHTQWSLFTLTLTSSYQGWGLGHLDRDTDEIAQCVHYIIDHKASTASASRDRKVVLMGHSTGSQDVLHYLYRSNPHTSLPAFDRALEHVIRPAVDGAILQAPVSDRECILSVLERGSLGRAPSELQAVYNSLVATAQASIREGSGNDNPSRTFDTFLPQHLAKQLGYPSNTPLSARRFLSLVSPTSPSSPSEDDLFSSDISSTQLEDTFGMISRRGLLRGKLLVLPSGADHAMPHWVDKEALMARWRTAADRDGEGKVWERELSAIVPGASHDLSNDDQAGPRGFLVEKVVGFLSKTEKSI